MTPPVQPPYRPIEATRSPFVIGASLVLIATCLYLAQAILIPVALALLLTFLLAPVANWLESIGLGRVFSVIIVVVLAFIVLAAIGWIVTAQITTLAGELPKYESNIKRKIGDLRNLTKGGTLEQVKKSVEEIKEEIQKSEEPKRKQPAPREVVVQSGGSFPFMPSAIVVGPFLARLATAGLVVLLVIFMLVRREDLRNRFIRLVGHGRVPVTTRALEEAAERISRYLLVQAIINSVYGIAVGIGLYLIGLPYAVLWGLVGAVLRFIPYVGPWVAAIMPSALGLAFFDGWVWPLAVICLFITVELFTNMVLETLLWGESAGVSEVALLISVAFWTWLWGPIGLLLATPLTVCLVVIGKYVPQMEFITILMSDAPVVESKVIYYQRLLAGDKDEAAHIVTRYLEKHPRERVYDEVLLPALSYARADRERGGLTDTDEEFIFQATGEIVAGLRLDGEAAEASGALGERSAAVHKVKLLGCPASDEADEVALRMLQQLLDPRRYELEIVPEEKLTSEVVSIAGENEVDIACIIAVPPGGLAQTRHLCKRLKRQFPELKIVVGWWSGGDQDQARNSLLSAGADQVATSLLETRDQITNLRQLVSEAGTEANGSIRRTG